MKKFKQSNTQILIIYTLEILMLTLAFLIHKTQTLSGKWMNQTFNNTDFEYTQYEIEKCFKGAYEQLIVAQAFISNIFTDNLSTYPVVPMCTFQTCFQIQKNNPCFDFQYQQLGVYQGVISNSTQPSIFGNLGSLLWQFKYMRGSSIQNIQIVLSSSIQAYNLKLHIPIQSNLTKHHYVVEGKENCSCNPENIIFYKSFNFTNNSETLEGVVSVKVNFQNLKKHLELYRLRIIRKQHGTVYINTLKSDDAYSTKEVQFKIGNAISIPIIIEQENIILKTTYVQHFYTFCVLFFIVLFPIFQIVNNFFRKQIHPINSISSILRDKLNYSFDTNQNRNHNLISINQQINKLCGRCEQLPNYNIKKQDLYKETTPYQQFKFAFKLNELSQKFKSKVKIEDPKYIYNNKFIIKIGEQFEIDKKILKGLSNILRPESYFKLAYSSICYKSEKEFLSLLNQNLRKYDLKKQQKQIFQNFYHIFHSPTIVELSRKINQTNNLEDSSRDITQQMPYFEVLYLSQKQRSQKGVFFKSYYEKVFFQRIRSIILSKYILYVKDSDKDFTYLKQSGFKEQIQSIQKQIDNLRYQMSKKEVGIRSAT